VCVCVSVCVCVRVSNTAVNKWKMRLIHKAVAADLILNSICYLLHAVQDFCVAAVQKSTFKALKVNYVTEAAMNRFLFCETLFRCVIMLFYSLTG